MKALPIATLLLAGCAKDKDAPKPEPFPLPEANQIVIPDEAGTIVFPGETIRALPRSAFQPEMDGYQLLVPPASKNDEPPRDVASAVTGDWAYLGLTPDTPASELAPMIAALPGKCVGVLAIRDERRLGAVPLKRCCGDRACDRGRRLPPASDDEVDQPTVLSIYVRADQIWISQSRFAEHVAIRVGADDLAQLRETLTEIKLDAFFAERRDAQLAVDPTIRLDRLLAVRDVAVTVGFEDLQLLAPTQLVSQPVDGVQDPEGYEFLYERAASDPEGSAEPRRIAIAETIGHGAGTGESYGLGGGRGGMRGRSAAVPAVRIGEASGDIPDDVKATIRRYIKRNLPKIKYCYEKELLASPKLSGTVEAKFVIEPTGEASNVKAKGINDDVAGCVGGVIDAISFPAPKDGKAVTVTSYTFELHPSGG